MANATLRLNDNIEKDLKEYMRQNNITTKQQAIVMLLTQGLRKELKKMEVGK